jgi:hypothetical protein
MSIESKSTKVKNPAAALLDQDGVFEVTSPNGDVFCVTCQKGVGMSFARLDETQRKGRAGSRWEIRRQTNSKLLTFPRNSGRSAA